jgi:hypothetical protein
MGRPRHDRAGHGAGARCLSLLLAGLFATGFLPAAGPGCDCTAEHNCGCTCWLERVVPAATLDVPGGPRPSCCARETNPERAAAASCAARTLPDDGSAAPAGGGSPTSHERRLLDWELAAAPSAIERATVHDLAPAASLAHDSLPLEPLTPPPRTVPSA